MAISIVQLGSARKKGEGLRIGTVRRPPRGVRKADFARLNYYDVWLPTLSPSQALLSEGMPNVDERVWKAFAKKFKAEMKEADAAKVLDLLASLSHQTNFSIGCYCDNEKRCHRSILRELLKARGASLEH